MRSQPWAARESTRMRPPVRRRVMAFWYNLASASGNAPQLTVRHLAHYAALQTAGNGIAMANKIYADASSALDGLLRDDMIICCGGFGLSGVPERLIDAIVESGVKNLTFVSNN